MFALRTWFSRVLGRPCRPACRQRRIRPLLEALEDRLTPAFNLSIGAGATTHVLHDGAGRFTATGAGANISVADIRADLLAGKNVVISNGAGGGETGMISWQPGADLDYNGLNGAPELSIAVDASATIGLLDFNSRLFDSDTTTADALNVNISAIGTLAVENSILAGGGTITLAAGVKPDGTGVSGAGMLTVGPGVTISGSEVSLRGADAAIDPTATVTATGGAAVGFVFLTGAANMAQDAQGNLYVGNFDSTTVTRISADGQTITTFATGLDGVDSLAFDPQGNLYVCGFDAGQVRKISPDGKTVTNFAGNLHGPDGLACDAQGNLYVATFDDNSVRKISADGQTITVFASNLHAPRALAIDVLGNLYVANDGDYTVVKISPNGQTITPYASGLFLPEGLALDSQQNLYVTNGGNQTITKVSPDGKKTLFATGFANPVGVVVDAQGNLLVGDPNHKAVWRVSPGQITVHSSLPARPMSVGGADNAVVGVNLTDAELRTFHAGALVFGDASQAGNITFTTVSTTAPVVALQDPFGQGAIVLDTNSGGGPAIYASQGGVTLQAGNGGIHAAAAIGVVADIITTSSVTLDTAGSIGTAASRIRFDVSSAPAALLVGPSIGPAAVFLDGSGPLALGNIQGHVGAMIDVTARAGVTVLPGAVVNVPAGTITLAADANADGTGEDGTGTLSIRAGASISAANVNLRGADVSIDASASVTATGSNLPVAPFGATATPASGMAVDLLGNVYVTDSQSGKVFKFNPHAFTAAIFSQGFFVPTGLAIDARGNVYVANYAGDTVSRISPDGRTVTTFATGFHSPFGLVFDGQGNLYVSNTGDNTVSKVSPDGQTVTTFATGFHSPFALVFDGQGNLLVTNRTGGTVSKVSPDGMTVTTFATGLNSPGPAVFDSQGNLIVGNVDNNDIAKISPDGTKATSFAGAIAGPYGLALDGQGNLIVLNFSGGLLQRVGLGEISVSSSLGARPISVGGADNAVTGINLTDAELATFHAGKITFGAFDSSGDINLTTATLHADVLVQQDPASAAKIVLDDGAGSGAALATGKGGVTLQAGTGGIRAAGASNAVAEIDSTGRVFLDSSGPVGTLTNRIQFGNKSPLIVTIGSVFAPSGVFLDGLGNLSLGNVQVALAGVLDVSARGGFNVAPGAAITAQAGTLTLAADVKPDGTGDDGIGTLSVGAGAIINGADVKVRGADMAIDPTASITATGGAVSAFASGFSHPAALAFDTQGNLYVANALANTVSKVSPDGKTVVTFAIGFDQPFGLAFDAQGNLYVSNSKLGNANGATVFRVTPDGKTVSLFASGLNAPAGLAFDAQGNLYVANYAGNTVSKVSPDGKTVVTFASGFNGPGALAFDAQGYLYVTNTNSQTISRVSPDGKTVTTFGPSFDGILGLAFDAQGNLYVGSLLNNVSTLTRVSPDGQTAAPVATTGLNYPYGLAVDAQGNLYVANAFADTISKVKPAQLSVRSSLGTRPINAGGADGAVTGVNLTAAELATFHALSFAFGDGNQTGELDFANAGTLFAPGSSVLAQSATVALAGAPGANAFELRKGAPQTLAVNGTTYTISGSTSPVHISSDSPTFRWTAVPGAQHYDLWVDDVTTGQSQVVRLPLVKGLSVTVGAEHALLPGHTYRWWAGSVTAQGVTTWGAAQTFTVTALAAPSLTGSTGAINGDRPTFAWTAVTGADHYDLWVNDQTTGQTQVLRVPNIAGTSLSASAAQALTPGHRYLWWAGAVSSNGQVTVWSVAQTLDIAALAAPAALNPHGAILSDRPTFTWNTVTSADHYDLWVDDQTTGQVQALRVMNLAGTSFTPSAVQALTPGHSYRWWIGAVSTNGQATSWSAAQTFNAPSLTAPTLLGPTSAIASDRPTFIWGGDYIADHYDLWVDDQTTGQGQVLRVKNVAGTSLATSAAQALTPGHAYIWWAGSVSTNGLVTVWSASRTFTIAPLAAPTATSPTGLIANTMPTFNWTAVAGADHYDLWVDSVSTGQSQVARVPNASGTSLKLTAALAKGTYRWWIGAVSTNGLVTVWSAPQIFNVNP